MCGRIESIVRDRVHLSNKLMRVMRVRKCVLKYMIYEISALNKLMYSTSPKVESGDICHKVLCKCAVVWVGMNTTYVHFHRIVAQAQCERWHPRRLRISWLFTCDEMGCCTYTFMNVVTRKVLRWEGLSDASYASLFSSANCGLVECICKCTYK